MARYDPRYNYNLGYGLGGGALGLADILGQGFDRLHRINQDEQGQQNNQRDYLLKLTEFLSQNQDRGLDRQMKQQGIDYQGKQIEDLIANRKAKADTAAAGQSAIAKFFAVPDVTTQEPAPQPPPQALAVSPQAEDRTLGQFIYGKRRPTPQEAFTSMGPEAANLPDNFSEKLLAFYKDQAPKSLGYGESPLGIYSKDTGDVKTPALEKPPAIPKPFAEGKTPTELELYINDPSTPPDQRKIAQSALTSIRAAELQKARETGAIAADTAATRAMGPQPSTGDERKLSAESQRAIKLGDRAVQTLDAHPEFAGGVFGVRGRGNALLLKLNKAPEGFSQFKTDLDEVTGTYARRIAGAALTPTEEARYLKYLPDVKSDSDQEIVYKIRQLPERYRELEQAIEQKRLGTAAPQSATPTSTRSGKPDFRYNPATKQLEPVE